MIKKVITGFLVLSAVAIQAQVPDDFIRIDISKIEGAKILQERTFTKESLFGYMNGGAELYLEYGFDRLVVSDLDYNGNTLKVEIYRMPSVDKAFGIYSVNIFRCDSLDGPCDYYCVSDYQLQLCKGEYYVNIINNSGSSEGLKAAKILAQQLTGVIEGSNFDINEYIPGDFMPDNIEKLFLISGDVALGNYAFEYANYIEGYSGYIMLIVESDNNAMLIIRFKTGDQLEKFRNSMGIDQFPTCGEKIALNDIFISLTDKGDIILHIDIQ